MHATQTDPALHSASDSVAGQPAWRRAVAAATEGLRFFRDLPIERELSIVAVLATAGSALLLLVAWRYALLVAAPLACVSLAALTTWTMLRRFMAPGLRPVVALVVPEKEEPAEQAVAADGVSGIATHFQSREDELERARLEREQLVAVRDVALQQDVGERWGQSAARYRSKKSDLDRRREADRRRLNPLAPPVARRGL